MPNDVANAVTQDVVPVVISKEYGAKYTTKTIQDLVDKFASQYEVSPTKMMATIECESHFKNVQSDFVKDGKREDSWGISQINLYWNPSVEKDQALDPVYSVEWMAKAFSQGEARKWSCYRMIYQ